MNDSPSQCSQILSLLEQAGAGSPAALDALLRGQADRLTQLARRMLWRYPGVKRWAETDDVLQNALVRLVRALQDVKPQSLGEFFSLATLQIRRELIDLARHHYGALGAGAHHASVATPADGSAAGPPAYDAADHSGDPGRLALWTEFHRAVDAMPDDEREVFDANRPVRPTPFFLDDQCQVGWQSHSTGAAGTLARPARRPARSGR